VSGTSIAMTVNGRPVTVEVRSPGQTLLEVLRGELHLTGTKAGCEAGECGACTVLLDGQPVTSCLVPALAAEGAVIETIEGLSPGGSTLHPVQAALVAEGAVQCGYCTPGVVMSAVALLREEPCPSEARIREALAGNLCRCTGYARIIRAVTRASADVEKP
jgi:carbon-monoxide dehydrogenase small subunit